MKFTDLKIDKTKERGQIRSITYDDVAKKAAGYQALQPPRPLRVTAWETSGMTRSTFLHKARSISFPCCDVLRDLHCRWLTLRSERATQDGDMPEDSEHAASKWLRAGGLARILLCSPSQV